MLVLWVAIGLAELIVHDSGNERRYVMFIPALTALAALVVSRAITLVPSSRPQVPALALVLVTAPLAYLVVGSAIRPMLIAQIEAHQLSLAVRVSAGVALIIAGLSVLLRNVARLRVASPTMTLAVGLWCGCALGWNAFEYARWTTVRGEQNFEASVALGRMLAPGTVVQGKLANGMALENRIHPIFVGNGFGNYDDRLRRDDARYILTYDLPSIGYESSRESGLIQGILDHYPRRRLVATFVVDETPGPDRAVLIDKEPDALPAHARD